MNWPFDFSSATPAQIETEVMRAWNDQTSDLFFTRRWLFMSEDERMALLVRWNQGNQHTFKEMMRLVWYAFAPHVSEVDSQWTFSPSTSCFAYKELGGDWWNHSPEPPVAFRLWGKALARWFDPHWNKELVAQHPCMKNSRYIDDHYFRVDSIERTFHEQLEAARTLREWLDEREARGELEAAIVARLRETLR